MELISREDAVEALEQRREIVLNMAGYETDEIHAIDGCIDDIKALPTKAIE